MSNSMAQRIKNLRRDKGLTLEQVAQVVGVGKSTVRKWETGMIANMKQDKIASLAKALGTTPDYLLGLDPQSQLDSLAQEIAQLKKEISTAPAERLEELEYQLALKEESYEDQYIGFSLLSAQKEISPAEPGLTEGEKVLLELFRKVPEDKQPMVLQMIEVALRNL